MKWTIKNSQSNKAWRSFRPIRIAGSYYCRLGGNKYKQTECVHFGANWSHKKPRPVLNTRRPLYNRLIPEEQFSLLYCIQLLVKPGSIFFWSAIYYTIGLTPRSKEVCRSWFGVMWALPPKIWPKHQERIIFIILRITLIRNSTNGDNQCLPNHRNHHLSLAKVTRNQPFRLKAFAEWRTCID